MGDRPLDWILIIAILVFLLILLGLHIIEHLRILRKKPKTKKIKRKKS